MLQNERSEARDSQKERTKREENENMIGKWEVVVEEEEEEEEEKETGSDKRTWKRKRAFNVHVGRSVWQMRKNRTW